MNQASLELWKKELITEKPADWCEKNKLSTHAYFYIEKNELKLLKGIAFLLYRKDHLSAIS